MKKYTQTGGKNIIIVIYIDRWTKIQYYYLIHTILKKKINIFMDVYVSGASARNRSPSTIAMELFEQHQGTHILQVSTKNKTIFKYSIV